MKSRLVLLTIRGLIAFAWSQPSNSENLDELQGLQRKLQILAEKKRVERNFVVPDEFYISSRCVEQRETENGNYPDSLYDAKAIEHVAAELTLLCDRAAKKEVLPDRWFSDFQGLQRTLERLTTPVLPAIRSDASPEERAQKLEELLRWEEQLSQRESKLLRIYVPPAELMPSDFAAYSLFLFPSAEWGGIELKDELNKIRNAFSSFGDATGNQIAAIWFTTRFDGVTPDIGRSKYYADRFGLNYNDGPFVVTSSVRPDAVTEKDELVVIKLGGVSAKRVVKILNVLEQDLRRHISIRKRPLIFEEIKQRLLSAFDDNPEIEKELKKDAIGVLSK
jgi:hypothetical protein